MPVNADQKNIKFFRWYGDKMTANFPNEIFWLQSKLSNAIKQIRAFS
jgi:hypothetical protein